MFGRPRCREWTPLVTQQLRLRSLIQIVGYNIRPPEWCSSKCSFYLTLHHTTMSAPFYTSEKICSPHPKWKEIDSDITQCMSSTNVVIRVWCHFLPTNKDDNQNSQDRVIHTWGLYFSGLRYIGANLASNFTSDCFKCNTLVLQMHGGYFCSYKSLKLEVMPPENEMEHGSLSSDSSGRTNLSKIVLESKFIQNHKLKEPRSISPSKYPKKVDKEYSKSQSPVDKVFHQSFPTMKTSASLNISQRDYPKRRDDSAERNKNDPTHIYEHSPDKLDVKEFTTSDVHCESFAKHPSREDLTNSKVDLSETAENYDLRSESDGVPKYRYMALNFLKSEIRPSYNASKLQKLHLLQYSIKKRQDAVQEIKERIYKKSALNDDKSEDIDKVSFRSRSQKNLFSTDDGETLGREKSSSQTDLIVKNGRIRDDRPLITNGPRLTLKLNDLLSFKAKPSPFQRAEHVRLTKQLEILRFKRIILSDERDGKLANIRRLKEKHLKLFEENQDVGSELMQNYYALSKRAESLRETRQSCDALRELAARTHAALATARAELLHQLHHIFHIEQKEGTTWSICSVELAVCGDERGAGGGERGVGGGGRGAGGGVRGAAGGAAGGLAAQAACIAATLLDHPLRYKVTLLGSASKILDVTPDLPDPNIPLYPRGGDVTLYRYGMFLLNKLIAQLLVGRGLQVTDIRPTLANLQRLLTAPTNLSDTSKLFGLNKCVEGCPRTQSLRSLVASERGKYRQFNRFKDSVDGHSPQTAMNLRRHRHSRSVGSYHDDHELPTLDASTTSIMGSESNIYNMKLTQVDSAELPCNSIEAHNSDSEIHLLLDDVRKSNDNNVIFTLGDNETLVDIQSERLVRISTNNDDQMTCSTCVNDDVKQICTEIEDFCSANVSEMSNEVSNEMSNLTVLEGFDVASHMGEIDIAKYMESKTNEVVEYDSECDLECVKNVMDVIVIPSAEAILDTGQGDGLTDRQSQ